MSFLPIVPPEKATGDLKAIYEQMEQLFGLVPQVFVAMSPRPDLLGPLATYIKGLLIDTHALPRVTKELIAAHVSKINSCAY